MTIIALSSTAFKVKEPSAPVIVAFAVPLTATVALDMGFPCSSRTRPVTSRAAMASLILFLGLPPNVAPPSQPAQAFFLLSTVRRKRNDSVPVSMMCARSVIRSSNALHNRGFGNTVVHSENGRFVVTMRTARSARSEIT